MKPVLRVVLAIFFLITLMISVEGNLGILFGISVSKAETLGALAFASNPLNRVFINQSFDTEPVGAIPTNWTMLYPQYGNISVVNSTWYGSGATGKSGMIRDSYTDNNPVPYRLFPQQNSTVAISFAIKPTSNIGVKKTIEVYIDDSNFNGAYIAFKNGQIGYQDKYQGFSVLRDSYIPDTWYKVRMSLNIPQNSYSIYIDDHLAQANVAFTGSCTQIHRIVFNETSGQDANLLPVAFIDEILGVQGIEVPKDYGTIQEGINAANQGDLVFVTKQRTYFESITIPTGKDGIWLYGEDVNTTIIDESFAQTGGYGQSMMNGISVHASNVRISGLTIRSTSNGAGIVVDGAYNTIENSVVINGLGDGIAVSSTNNTITGSVIKTNVKCGILMTGSNTTLTGNIIELNDQQGVLISSWNSDIEDNVIRSNLGCGIQIVQGEQNFIRNNTIKKNKIGIECDASARNNLIYENRFVNNTLQASNADATNAWDDSYPYAPDKEVGGGNFWSDFNSADVYSGKSQDQSNGSLPAPDGICDQPYRLSSVGVDNYPLFLIQNVTQDPRDPANISYTTPVNVTATILNSLDMGDAHLEVQFDSSVQNINMTISGNRLRGTIPLQGYGTSVTYNVTAHAESAEVFVKSTNYPLSGHYFVGDKAAPSIGVPVVSPLAPTTKQTILISVNVTEPQNASGVNRVSLTYYVNGTPWTASMNTTGNNTYYAFVPPQAWDGTLNMSITAIDNAGNSNSTSVFNVPVSTPELTVKYKNVVCSDPFTIDLGVLSSGQIVVDSNLTFTNTGRGNLTWSINMTKFPTWIKITPSSGAIAANGSIVVKITVDTKGLDNDSYSAELDVTASGLVPSFRIYVNITIREIIIDDSYASSETPRRCDVNTIQSYGFHAAWKNHSDPVVGAIEVKGIGWVTVDEFGWANFTDISLDHAERTYYVEGVNFTYEIYIVNRFAQEASNLTTIWDRVKVASGGSSNSITTVGTTEEVWFSAVYESDNAPFNGTDGVLYLHVYKYDLNTHTWSLVTAGDSMNWSATNNRWEKSYSFDSQGARNFTVSKVDDKLFNLTTIQNSAGSIAITWLLGGSTAISGLEVPLWAIIAIALTLGFGMTATLIILIRPTRNRNSKEDFKSRKN